MMATKSRFRAGRRLLAGIALAAGLAAYSFVAPPAPPSASAAVPNQFDRGYIISDAKFFDGGALSADEVQAQLKLRVPVCRAGAGSPGCLRNYSTSVRERAERPGRCGAIPARESQTAAQIIATVGRACGISQKALLVLLEKEQGLVSATAPSESRYRIAMGFGCPDTAACDANYFGFSNQVYAAAYQFKVYATTANQWSIRAGRVNDIRLHPNAGCGTRQVAVRNQATAGLYIYTPYTPNDAAMNNLYGSGDVCSSYGNRNFWRIYTDWFGSPTDGSSPIGGMDVKMANSGEIQVNGWTIDRDSADPVNVHVYVDGNGPTIARADAFRPDVGAVYPQYGDRHGIDMRIVAASGRHEVCAFAMDSTGDANTRLGCQSVMVENFSPFGGMNAFSTDYSGSITVNGWAIDPETAAPIDVHVYVDGVGVSTVASASRPDVGAVYPAFGSSHGIDVTVPATAGDRNVCAYGINVGRGVNTHLGCQRVVVDDLSPFGDMNVRASHQLITVNGWTIDPETKAPIGVHIYVDGAPVAVSTASTPRPDIAAAYPAFGPNHGIDVSVGVQPGPRNVCAYGINVGVGDNRHLGCRTIIVPNQSPFGDMDVTAEPGGARVRGWAIDPDTSAPIDVHIYIASGPVGVGTANVDRPDVGRVFPTFGSNHGMDLRVPLPSGVQNVCAYGINVGQGTNNLLGCQSVTRSG